MPFFLFAHPWPGNVRIRRRASEDRRLALGYNLFYNTGMLKLKVRAVGGSLGIILPKEALAKMKVQENDEVFLTEAPGGGYRLTPYSPEFERQMGVVEEIAKRRRNVLRELAK